MKKAFNPNPMDGVNKFQSRYDQGSLSVKKKIHNFVLLIAIGILAHFQIITLSYAQCDALGNECAPNVDPFVCTEYNHVVVGSGEVAEFVTTFYAGEKYKIVVCGRDGLGNVNFKLLNSKGELLFDNANENGAPIWEFEFNSTNNYIIQAELTSGARKELTSGERKGCIVVLIGFDYH